jgi:hypothetical protein
LPPMMPLCTGSHRTSLDVFMHRPPNLFIDVLVCMDEPRSGSMMLTVWWSDSGTCGIPTCPTSHGPRRGPTLGSLLYSRIAIMAKLSDTPLP